MRRNYVDDSSIRELDLELELLKRKRQVIQEKRHIMMEEQQFTNMQHHNSPWADPMMNYGSSLNPLPYVSNSNMSSNVRPMLKRSVEKNAWENPPKRFAGPPKSRNPYGDHVAAGPSGGIRPSTRVSGTPHHSGTGGGSTRGPGTVKAPKQGPMVYNTGTGIEDRDLILRPGVEPSNRLTGRLELVLGTILKELRTNYSGTTHAYGLRMVKETLRERIRKVLQGKYVGNLPVNMTLYWRAYPKHSSADLVKMLGLDDETKQPEAKIVKPQPANQKPSIMFSEEFREKVRDRVTATFAAKLDEMFNKLEKLYEEEKQRSKETGTEQSSDLNIDQEGEPTKKKIRQTRIYKSNEAHLYNTLESLLPSYRNRIMKMLNGPNIIYSSISYEKEANWKNTAAPTAETSNVYVVKILGAPTLPKKPTMTNFLKEFKPSGVKRHKQLMNALFVTLTSEAHQNALLAKDGTVIENCTISIKKCTFAETKNKPNDTSNKAKPVEKKQQVANDVTKQASSESAQEAKPADTTLEVNDDKIISAIEKGNIDIDDQDFFDICNTGNAAEAVETVSKVIEVDSQDKVEIDEEKATETKNDEENASENAKDDMTDKEKAIELENNEVIDKEKAIESENDRVIDEENVVKNAKYEGAIEKDNLAEVEKDVQKVIDVDIDDDCQIVNISNDKIVIPDDDNEDWVIDDKGINWDIEPESNGVDPDEGFENVDSELKDNTAICEMGTDQVMTEKNN